MVGSVVAWVTDPGLIETVLLMTRRPPEAQLKRRVLRRCSARAFSPRRGWGRAGRAPAAGRSFAPPTFGPGSRRGRRGGRTGYARSSASPAGSVHAVDRDMTQTAFQAIVRRRSRPAARQRGCGDLAALRRQGTFHVSSDIAAALLRFPDWLWYPGRPARHRAAWPLRAAVATILARRRAEGLHVAARRSVCGPGLRVRKNARTGEPRCRKSSWIDDLVTFLAAGQ